MDLIWKTVKMLTCTGLSVQGSTSEDSASQATSVVSEEAVPILGRRAERESRVVAVVVIQVPRSHSERSDNSDSDWELRQVCSDYSHSCTRIAVLVQINFFICGLILKLLFELNSVHEIFQFAILIWNYFLALMLLRLIVFWFCEVIQ